MKTLIIIPAYNEEESIESVVGSVMQAGYDYVVVNDGSTDTTLDLCRRNGFSHLDLSKNLGIGGAVQAGHKYALEHGYDADVQFDGDGQHDVSCIPRLLAEIKNGADLVIGSRFISDENQFHSTLLRRAGIKWLKHVIKASSGCTVTDCTSGFRACSKRALRFFADDYPSDYPEPESIARAARKGFSIIEVPAIMHERSGGSSSIGGLSSVYYMLKVTIAVLIAGIGEGNS